MTAEQIIYHLRTEYAKVAQKGLAQKGLENDSFDEAMMKITMDMSWVLDACKDNKIIHDYVVICNDINNPPPREKFPRCTVCLQMTKDVIWKTANLSDEVVDTPLPTSNKIVYILCGPPGSGKSTKAKQLSPHVFEADNYWLNCVGDYLFVPSKIKRAHQWCQAEVEKALKEDSKPICVANTSLTPKERQPYIDLAKKYGYAVELVLPDSPWFLEMLPRIRTGRFTHKDVKILFDKNTHNVPFETIENMLGRWNEDFEV